MICPGCETPFALQSYGSMRELLKDYVSCVRCLVRKLRPTTPCLECNAPIDIRLLEDHGIAECAKCRNRFVRTEALALTYVDEIPVDEYLGG